MSNPPKLTLLPPNVAPIPPGLAALLAQMLVRQLREQVVQSRKEAA
jgi:hypothetical protein